MKKRGLTVNVVTPSSQAEFRTVAEEFATAMAGVKIPQDVLGLARKERDAFRKASGGAK
jgi:hypothetical protein